MLLIGELQGSMVGLTDDDLADCAVTFAEKMQRYRPSRDGEASLEPLFVHACARNHARDSLRAVVRSARRTVSLDGHPDAADSRLKTTAFSRDPESELLGHDLVYRILDALDRLKVGHRDLFVRHHLQGESIKSIALSLNLKPQVVVQRIYRARQTLRSRLIDSGLIEGKDFSCSKP